MQDEPNIAWKELTKFVSQFIHDLRNHLNAVELQAAVLNETVNDAETKTEVKSLRDMTGALGHHMRKLSVRLAPVKPQTLRYPVREFVEDLRAKLETEQPEQAREIEWQVSLNGEILDIDPQLFQEAFLELFDNAARYDRGEGSIAFLAERNGEKVHFHLREPKQKFENETAKWGRQPLRKVGSGHYGLGLFRARSIFEAHHGDFAAQFHPDQAMLVTTAIFPLVP